jgi:hypothetical protein
MGNKPVLKPAEKCALVMEQFLRLLHDCGMDRGDVDLLNGRGPVAERLILDADVRLTQFTGSSKVAEHLLEVTKGKVKIEDAGFDWKILGPDVVQFPVQFYFIFLDFSRRQRDYPSAGGSNQDFGHCTIPTVGLYRKLVESLPPINQT